MTIINESTVVVFNSSELKNALENDNGYTYIYLGANIQLENGIKISASKTNVTIDGTYNGITYQYEDKKSLGSGDTIYVNFPSILKVTVCNMKIIGYNYYGTIYVPESSTYKNTIIEYNNITYTGPQISFHPVGLTRFIDVNITIQDMDNDNDDKMEWLIIGGFIIGNSLGLVFNSLILGYVFAMIGFGLSLILKVFKK